MKKIICFIKNIIILISLTAFPTGVSLIIELVISGNIIITRDYIGSILFLLGAVISAYYFYKKDILNVKFNKVPLKTIIPIAGIGFALKPLLLCVLHFLISLNVSDSTSYSLILVLECILFVPIAEEILFRGILTDILSPSHSKSKFSIYFTIFVTSFLWTIYHLHGFSIPSLLLLIDGIIIGALYHKYRSILVCIVYHSFNNLAMIVLFGFVEEMWIQRLIITALIFVTSFSFLIFSIKEKSKII